MPLLGSTVYLLSWRPLSPGTVSPPSVALNFRAAEGFGLLLRLTGRLLLDLALPFHDNSAADTFRYGAKRIMMFQRFLHTHTLFLGNFQSVPKRDLSQNHLAVHFLDLALRLHLKLIGGRADTTRF